MDVDGWNNQFNVKNTRRMYRRFALAGISRVDFLPSKGVGPHTTKMLALV